MNHVTVTTLPDWLEFIKVLTRAVRSMAAGSMDSAGNSGRNDDLYSTFNLDYGNIIIINQQNLIPITDQYFLHQRRSDPSALFLCLRSETS